MSSDVSTWFGSPEELANALRPALAAGRLRTHVPLAPLTTFRIGGPADALYDATSADDLANAVAAARALRVPWFLLGLGANVLASDHGFRGLVIRNLAAHLRFPDTSSIAAESGVVVADLIRVAVGRGLSGLEHYAGIPSTVGGAVWQNLHFLSPAPQRERTVFVEEVVESVDLLDADGRRQTVDRDAMRFGYDSSRLHGTREIALGVTFRLHPGNQDAMHRVIQENLSWRSAHHPSLEFHPSAGSIFKKIEGVGAGRLVERCGLKGYRVGNAQISHLHANIIVNLGGATAADVRAVIAHAQRAVLETFGQRLETEIEMMGES